MATKKKTKKKSKKVVGKKALKSKPAKKRASPGKKLATKKAATKKIQTKVAVVGRKKTARKSAPAVKKHVRGRGQSVNSVSFAPEGLAAGSGGQSGDLQGLSSLQAADSESVDELLEEGNAFEAGVIKGVQEADDADEAEVHTHEVPEDDVPGEYLDKDK
jgi:hypothetical protein